MDGKSLEDEAKKKLNQKGFFGLFLEDDRMEKSAKLYKEAANKYIVEKKLKDAIRCLNERYQLCKSLNDHINLLDCLNIVVNSCCGALTTDEVIKYRQMIADAYLTSTYTSALTNRNKQLMEIAYLFEINGQSEKALESLNNCSEDKYESIKLSEKKISLCIKLKRYDDAFTEYKKLTDTQLKNYGMIFAKKNVMMTVICATVISLEKGKEMNNYYCFNVLDSKRSYMNSLEGIFTSNLVDAVECFDNEKFEIACGSYDRIIKFDAVQTSLLFLIKDRISGNDTSNEEKDDEPDFR